MQDLERHLQISRATGLSSDYKNVFEWRKMLAHNVAAGTYVGSEQTKLQELTEPVPTYAEYAETRSHTAELLERVKDRRFQSALDAVAVAYNAEPPETWENATVALETVRYYYQCAVEVIKGEVSPAAM